MTIRWADSADKWGISHEDALYAMNNATYASTKVKVNNGDTEADRRVFIGKPHAQTERLLEVLVEIIPPGTIVVYHVMELGSYYRSQMEDDQ